jgi:class 3 adenylate cyclase
LAAYDAARAVGLELRAGVHAGECQRSGGKLVGVAVHAGQRIDGRAAPGEILTSGIVKDLVAGFRLEFEDRGEHELKGSRVFTGSSRPFFRPYGPIHKTDVQVATG